MAELIRNEILISDNAKVHFLRQLSSMANAGEVKGVRFWIKDGKGCGGSEYMIDIVKDVENMDFIALDNKFSLYINSIDLFRLLGTQIDFGKGELGFEQVLINNPNESGQCGCGMSVTFDDFQ